MAQTDAIYEFGREPGFSSSVYSPDSSHMLHLCEIQPSVVAMSVEVTVARLIMMTMAERKLCILIEDKARYQDIKIEEMS